MPDELRSDSSQPPDPQPARPDHGTTRPDRSGEPASETWTWPMVTLTCVLVLSALIFAGVLVWTGTDPKTAGVVALLLVTGIVLCVVPSRPGGSLVRRMADALAALAGKGGNQ